MLGLIEHDEIPAEALEEVLNPGYCQGGEMVQVGEDEWTGDYCTADPVPGYDFCRTHGGRPGLETFEGSPVEPGAPQSWWLR